MSYRAFAIGTLLAAPIMVMAVQSFTPDHHIQADAPAVVAAPVAVAPIQTMPPPVQDAPAGPAPVFGQPLAGAGQPMTPMGDTSASDTEMPAPDTAENF